MRDETEAPDGRTKQMAELFLCDYPSFKGRSDRKNWNANRTAPSDRISSVSTFTDNLPIKVNIYYVQTHDYLDFQGPLQNQPLELHHQHTATHGLTHGTRASCPCWPASSLLWAAHAAEGTTADIEASSLPRLNRNCALAISSNSSWAKPLGQMVVYIHICIYLYLSIYLSIYVSIYPSIHPSIYLSTYMYMHI